MELVWVELSTGRSTEAKAAQQRTHSKTQAALDSGWVCPKVLECVRCCAAFVTPRRPTLSALEILRDRRHGCAVTKVQQIEQELASLSSSELRQIRQWIDEVLEDEMQFTPAFEAVIRESEREMAEGKRPRVRKPSAPLEISHGDADPEAIAQVVAEVWDGEDWQAASADPTR